MPNFGNHLKLNYTATSSFSTESPIPSPSPLAPGDPSRCSPPPPTPSSQSVPADRLATAMTAGVACMMSAAAALLWTEKTLPEGMERETVLVVAMMSVGFWGWLVTRTSRGSMVERLH